MQTYTAIIIGAGQAGLAAAHELVRLGLAPGADFLVLDADEGPGGAWRDRWDSLVFGRAHGIADLPGLPLGRPPREVPASRVVAEYYGRYEEEFGLAVRRPVQVLRVEEDAERPELLRLTAREDVSENIYLTRYVLSAAGTWTSPYVPAIPGIGEFRGTQLHTRDYVRREDFAGRRTLVVGGGLSAVQFLLELAPVTETIWATRRPPNFTDRGFDAGWGREVEEAVRTRTAAGRAPASVVRTTGIPLWEEYVRGVEQGVLVSRGMPERLTPTGAVWGPDPSGKQLPADREPRAAASSGGLGPSASEGLVMPASWDPFPAGHEEPVDVVFWNTGFRPALNHLAPLGLREPGGGIRMLDEVSPARDRRILLVGYGSTASTIGANRAGRLAGRTLARRLAEDERPRG